MIQFATKETIKYINRTVPLKHERKPTDHVLGGIGPAWTPVNSSGKWLQYAWDNPEIQRVNDGDTFWCVTFSHNSGWRFIWKAKYNQDLNTSERFLAIGSGTKRGFGNSKVAVAEWARKNGFVLQDDCPTPLTLDACYAAIDADLLKKGLANLATVDIGYKFLADNSNATIGVGLTFSPVQVDVQEYYLNDKGYVINNPIAGDYIHEVIIVEDMGDFYAVWDSENTQWLKYDKSFVWGSPMIHSITQKKTMFIKLAGHNALFSPSPTEVGPSGKPAIIPYEDGDVYKLVNQTASYANIKTYATLADLQNDYDFGSWIAAKETWDAQSFINSLNQ